MTLPVMDLTIDEDEHLYRTPSGLILPSVTHILRFLKREFYDNTPAGAMEDAAERGHQVHEQTRQFDAYGFSMNAPGTEPYMTAYLSFLRERKPQWVAREWMGYHKIMKYAGTIDSAGYVTPDDGTGVDVVDIKTTSVILEKLVAPQVSAYAEMLRSWGIKVRNLYCLQLKADGKYALVKLPNKYNSFMFCLGLHNECA